MKLFKRKNKTDYGFSTRRSLGSRLGSPFQSLITRLGGSEDQLGQRLPLATRLWRALAFILIFPFWIVFQIGVFVIMSWTTTRNGSAAFWSILPVAGILAVAGVTIASNFLEDRLTKRIHRERVIAAEEIGEYDTAILCSRRVQNINDEAMWRFIHALTLYRAGKTEQSNAIVEELASQEFSGYAPAHMRLAAIELQVPPDQPGYQTRLAIARNHYERVLDADPDATDALVRLAKVKFDQGLTDEAMAMYARISGISPDVVPDLVGYLTEKGRLDDARYHTQRGLDSLRKVLEKEPNQPRLWEQLFDIMMIKKDHQGALRELNAAARQVTDPAVRSHINRLQSNVLVRFSRVNKNLSSRDNFRRKLILTCRAIQVFHRNNEALKDLIDLVVYPTQPEVSAWIDGEVRDSVAPAISHIITGVRDAVTGKLASSVEHFRLAGDGEARTAIVVNDIAYLIALEKDRATDALRLVSVAIEIWNTSALLFQTRGEILIKLQRYEEAVVDLNYVTEHIPGNPRVFEMLAECYENLGRPDEASRQRELAEAAVEQLRQEMLLRQQQAGN